MAVFSSGGLMRNLGFEENKAYGFDAQRRNRGDELRTAFGMNSAEISFC